MRGKVNVFNATLNMASTPVGATNWVPVGSTIGQDFVRLKFSETTDSIFEIGYGAPGQSSNYVAQRAFLTDPGGGEYHQIFNKNMAMFIRLVLGPNGSTSTLNSGLAVFNGFY